MTRNLADVNEALSFFREDYALKSINCISNRCFFTNIDGYRQMRDNFLDIKLSIFDIVNMLLYLIDEDMSGELRTARFIHDPLYEQLTYFITSFYVNSIMAI